MKFKELNIDHPDIEKIVKCNSCRHTHFIGNRSCVIHKGKWKDYCPKCLKARSYKPHIINSN